MDTERLIRAMERLVRTPISQNSVICQNVRLPELRKYVRAIRAHYEAGRAAHVPVIQAVPVTAPGRDGDRVG